MTIVKKSTVRMSCHCGSIQLNVFLSNGLDTILRCNCSMCIKNKGFRVVSVPLSDVVVDAIDSMTEYTFNSLAAAHVFCIVCGVHTHHQRRSTPANLCINVACINELNILDYSSQVINLDGINHSNDA